MVTQLWLWDGATAFGEACWAAIEGSGFAGLRRKMSDEDVDVKVVRREGSCRAAGTSNLTSNYFKRNATTKSRCYRTRHDCYKTRHDTTR
jgi:hypothetical protein